MTDNHYYINFELPSTFPAHLAVVEMNVKIKVIKISLIVKSFSQENFSMIPR